MREPRVNQDIGGDGRTSVEGESRYRGRWENLG